MRNARCAGWSKDTARETEEAGCKWREGQQYASDSAENDGETKAVWRNQGRLESHGFEHTSGDRVDLSEAGDGLGVEVW